MNNRKGFTLVELLVVMVILGIIIGLSFPAIRTLQQKNTDKKYTTFKDSLKSSAKLYVDSYDVDLFGRKETGCACVKYEELESKKLAKDIAIKDVTCDTDNSFVRINKIRDAYTYDSYIGCRDKKGSSVSIIYPKQEKPHTMASAGCDTMCNDEVTNGIYVYAYPANQSGYAKRHYTTVNIQSIAGINQGVEIYYAWSLNRENSESLNNYKRVRITVPSNQKEIMENEWNTDHSVTATSSKINTPAGKSGSYYLHVRVDRLYDLYDSVWKQGDGGKYLVFGPFNIDNEPPRLSYSFESSNSNYNSVAPKLNLDVDDNITSQNKLKICVSVKKSGYYYSIFYNGSTTKYIKGTTSRCGPDYASDYNFINNVYKNFYTPVALTTMENYGTSYPTAFSVIDEALNQTYVETSYKTSERYKLTYDSNGGKDCSPTYKYVMKKNSGKTTWGELCETTLENYVFDGWYTAKSGGTKVTKDTEVTKNITVYAHWKPQKYTVTLVKGTGISGLKLKGSTTLTQSLDYNSTYTINVSGVTDYYHFTKWTDENGKNISTNKSATLTVKGNITLTANGAKNGIQIHHYTNGGRLAPIKRQACPVTINCGSVCERTANLSGCTGNATGEVYLTGYTLFDATNWAESGIRDHNGPNATLYMTKYGYEPTDYWHVGSGNSTTLINEEQGWATGKDFAIAVGKGNEIKTGNVDINLYAGWKGDVHTITLNKNGGSGGTSTIYEYYNHGWYSELAASNVISTVTKPSRPNYTFSGYKTGSNCGGTTIIDSNGKITGANTSFRDSTTIYACWTPNIYTITINTHNATSAGTTTLYVKYNTGWFTDSKATNQISSTNKMTLPTRTYEDPYLVDYKLVEFNEKEDGSGSTIISASGNPTSGSTTKFSGNATIHAIWKKHGWEWANHTETDITKQKWKYWIDGVELVGWRELCPNNNPNCETKSWWYFATSDKSAVTKWQWLCPGNTTCEESQKRWYYFIPTDPDGNGYLNADMARSTTLYFDDYCAHFYQSGACYDGYNDDGVYCDANCN